MASTPVFKVCDAGLAAASVATPTGPFIEIASFAVGSAYGYNVDRKDTDLNGNKLYSGGIASYSYIGDNTIDVVCRIPADAGPFDFGEVALYLTDGTMFAKAAFSALQSKYSALGTNLATTYTFHCLLKLEQSVAVFKIVSETGESATLIQVDAWTDVIPPGLASDPDVQLCLVKELTGRGDATLLVQSSDTKWSPAGTYYFLGKYTLQDSSATWLEVAPADWPYMGANNALSDVEQLSIVAETSDGFFRSVATIQHIGNPVTGIRFLLNPNPLLNIPVIGDYVILHINDPGLGSLANKKNGSAWSISITGNAATADHATTADTALNCPAYLPLVGGVLSGNVGVKTERNAWGSLVGAFDFVGGGTLGGSAAQGTFLAQNAVWSGTAWVTKEAGVSSLFVLNADATMSWYSGANATKGSPITFTKTVTLDASGNMVSVANVSGFSDVRVKSNIEGIHDALDKVQGLNGVTFDRTDIKIKRSTGLIAQEVLDVLPEAVTEGPDGMLSVAYGNLAGLFVEALKELDNQIKEVRREHEELDNQMKEFERKFPYPTLGHNHG